MTFLVILITLSLQFFLKFSSYSYQIHWQDTYYRWVVKYCGGLMKKHNIFGILLLVMPIVIIFSLIFAIIYHLTDVIGYSIASLVLLWYCVDARDLHQLSQTGLTKDDLLLSAYQKVFAILFWYFIFGPIGLVLYAAVTALRNYLADQSNELFEYFKLLLEILDWVPVRLLGLSFALVGHFGAVFKEWIKSLNKGLSDHRDYVITWGNAALKGQEETLDAVIQLIYRAAIVWLTAMALVTIGVWIG